MKLTAEMLRQVISEEITKTSPKKPVVLTAEQLRQFVVSESLKVTSPSTLNEQWRVVGAINVIDRFLTHAWKFQGGKIIPPKNFNQMFPTLQQTARSLVSAVKELKGRDLEKALQAKMPAPKGYKVRASTDLIDSLKAISEFMLNHKGGETKRVPGPITAASSVLLLTAADLENFKSEAKGAKTSKPSSGKYRAGQIKKGIEVQLVQQALQKLGYKPGKDDSDYGPLTRKAIIKFQKDEKLGVDGLAGAGTLGALVKKLRTISESKEQPGNLSEGLADELTKMIAAKTVVGVRRQRAKKAPAEKPAEEKKAPAEKPAELEQVITPEEVPELGPVQAAEEEETPRRALDRSKRGYKRFLEKEGTREAISQGLDDLVTKKVVKSVKGALWVISTLKDDDGEPGKRMSTLHATLEDIVHGRGQRLKTEYDRLMKGYRKLIKRTQAGNRVKMRAKLSKKVLDGAKDAREKLGLG